MHSTVRPGSFMMPELQRPIESSPHRHRGRPDPRNIMCAKAFTSISLSVIITMGSGRDNVGHGVGIVPESLRIAR